MSYRDLRSKDTTHVYLEVDWHISLILNSKILHLGGGFLSNMDPVAWSSQYRANGAVALIRPEVAFTNRIPSKLVPEGSFSCLYTKLLVHWKLRILAPGKNIL